eukprot:CAMPEP_0179915556 /NCGR_PEP_ID=MMETSP0983-20121128/1739_1 /TAXON_ID=483367 /ORGANISM="non described non described, Strain CCMP 2436" /LENGTH=132 /DNA_ID=CAMNT_0021817985 /DNA_START=441 /DNA_END=837 /DNA_ORIENTATION=-
MRLGESSGSARLSVGAMGSDLQPSEDWAADWAAVAAAAGRAVAALSAVVVLADLVLSPGLAACAFAAATAGAAATVAAAASAAVRPPDRVGIALDVPCARVAAKAAAASLSPSPTEPVSGAARPLSEPGTAP